MTKADRTRQFIIERSASIINKKGVAGTSISDLMEATQLAKGGIYGNFESKEEICMEAFLHLSTIVGQALDHAVESKKTAREKLFALLDFYLNNVAGNEIGGCPLLNFGIEADDTNPAIRASVAKAIKASQRRIHKVVELGKDAGEFDDCVDAGLFAIKMFAMIEGAIFTSRVTGSKAAMTSIVTILKKEIGEV